MFEQNRAASERPIPARPEGRRPSCRPAAIALAVAAALAASAVPCRADLQLQIQDVTQTSPGAGYLDVTLTNTDPSNSSAAIGGFDYAITISSPATSQVTFTAATDTATATGNTDLSDYIFVGNSYADTLTPAHSLDGASALPTTSFYASDFANAPFSGTTLSPGQTANVGRIFFSMPTNLPVGSVVNFQLSDASVSDATGLNSYTPSSGQDGGGSFTVTPEPSTAAAVLMCLAALAGRGAWSHFRRPRDDRSPAAG